MASTNKTTNYNLSQFIGSDKPTYLGDYNSDMLKIDAQMKTNADNVATAISGIETATATANSANQTAQTANTTANSASATASEANTNASNAQSTANSALATATTAQSTANTANTNAQNAQASAEAIAQKLNLINFETISAGNISLTGNGQLDSNSVTLNTATNADGSMGKIYGKLKINCNTSTGKVIIPTQLRPKDSQGVATDLTINGIAIQVQGKDNTTKFVHMVSLTIKANGNVELDYAWATEPNDYNEFSIIASLLFLTPFNDEPIPTPDN